MRTIEIGGVRRAVPETFAKLLLNAACTDPHCVSLADLGAILDLGFRPEVFIRVPNFSIADERGEWILTKPLSPTLHNRVRDKILGKA